MNRLFGTDGIRDVAGVGNLKPETVRLVGGALGYIAAREPRLLGVETATEPGILVARDTRASGEGIAADLADGASEAGVRIVDAGILPTPVVAFLTRTLGYAAGIVISASHNPAEYNGIKVFDSRGYKASEKAERRIEELAASPPESLNGHGPVVRDNTLAPMYAEHLEKDLGKPGAFKGMKIVLDVAHGATSHIAPGIFESLGAEVVTIGNQPDGENINHGVGALHPEVMAEAVKKHSANAGFAFDGDGDRIIAADEKGNLLDGDFIMAVCGRHLKESDRLPGDTVVATVMSNLGLEKCLEKAGIRLDRTPVGDKYVAAEMLRTGAALGGEQSGHLIFMQRTTTGDCIWSAVEILDAMLETGRPLSELAACMTRYPQTLVNVRVRERRDLLEVPAIRKKHDEIVEKLAGSGRIVLRFSGTEPLARIMIEGTAQEEIEAFADELAETVKKEMGE